MKNPGVKIFEGNYLFGWGWFENKNVIQMANLKKKFSTKIPLKLFPDIEGNEVLLNFPFTVINQSDRISYLDTIDDFKTVSWKHSYSMHCKGLIDPSKIWGKKLWKSHLFITAVRNAFIYNRKYHFSALKE